MIGQENVQFIKISHSGQASPLPSAIRVMVRSCPTVDNNNASVTDEERAVEAAAAETVGKKASTCESFKLS